jgi:hypothetical protein
VECAEIAQHRAEQRQRLERGLIESADRMRHAAFKHEELFQGSPVPHRRRIGGSTAR